MVQGVGFRPFVHQLATRLQLAGWVNNSAQGVVIEVEGPRPVLETFPDRLADGKPTGSYLESVETCWLDPVGYAGFEIRPSDPGGDLTVLVRPDMATCRECLREVLDPANRRFGYPFTNCTHCGPRFSIVESLPYDRPNTSMKRFTMCAACQAEYCDPRDRRFHAQPNACPDCGPQLELWAVDGKRLSAGPPALTGAVEALRTEAIVAVKGLGGFHLMVPAGSEAAVQRLRERKHREEKPFALMFPSLESIEAECHVAPAEARLLRSAEAPIVLLQRRDSLRIPQSAFHVCPAVAPGNPYLGAMLPYTPLHHLLLAQLGAPVVATSGNLSDEPICIDEREAAERLRGIADVFLVHNRPIVRPMDDSIARVVAGRELVLRRARGYAPWPVRLVGQGSSPPPSLSPHSEPRQAAELDRSRREDCPTWSAAAVTAPCVLAVGAHLKNTVALAVGPYAFLSQHIGDLETTEAFHAFRRVASDLPRLYATRPAILAADAHPDYLSTRWAQDAGLPVVRVQHHYAHVLACMAENELEGPVLGVSWDGTGFGLDGMIWGGEFLRPTADGFERVAGLRPFRLPGGEAAVKEPRRTALGLLHEMFGDDAFEMRELAPLAAFTAGELTALRTALRQRINAPLTSSVGRLFDAVAALIGLRQRMAYEGQAAMELEFTTTGETPDVAYPVTLRREDPASRIAPEPWDAPRVGPPAARATLNVPVRWPSAVQAAQPPTRFTAGEPVRSSLGVSAPTWTVDWAPTIQAVLADLRLGALRAAVAARFHASLAEAIVRVAREAGEERVVLTGGCFQNRVLLEESIRRVSQAGFRPYWHQRIPPNDGGIALGQVVAARLAAARSRQRETACDPHSW
jgi:hydrogenase maturation protein HypF